VIVKTIMISTATDPPTAPAKRYAVFSFSLLGWVPLLISSTVRK
jgi:hypothetical protein